ncbi:hypothetical protein FBU30_001285, partial [Linnemannia zychae]
MNSYTYTPAYTFGQENGLADPMAFASSQYTFQTSQQQQQQQQQYHPSSLQQHQQQQSTVIQYSTATSGSGVPILTNEIGFGHQPTNLYYQDLPTTMPVQTVTPRSKRPKSLSAHDFMVETTSLTTGVDSGGSRSDRNGREGTKEEERGDVYYQ